jgi:hypothetical protein
MAQASQIQGLLASLSENLVAPELWLDRVGKRGVWDDNRYNAHKEACRSSCKYGCNSIKGMQLAY